MAKKKSVFICSNCGHQEPKWLGRCPSCGEWNTLQETGVEGFGRSAGTTAGRGTGAQPAVELRSLAAVETSGAERLSTGLSELDRVVGGGLVGGTSVLIGGEPGIGKSTLMLQAAANIAEAHPVLYVSGEESAGQIKSRALRLGIGKSRIELLSSTEVSAVETALNRVQPVVAVIDSVQTLYSAEIGPVPGTVNQVKYSSHQLAEWAREHGCTVFFVAHVTKEGTIAGPKVIEHMVDAVLYFEQSESDLRFLRAAKNRYGAIEEVGIFRMRETGLQPVTDPSSVFLVRRDGSTLPAGVVVAPVYEGSRVLLVEIQALTIPAKGSVMRTFSDRIDSRRVSRIAAVLEKHLGLRFSDQDIYVNVAGGIRIAEVGVELPLACALYSARTGLCIDRDTTVTGELSLAGEIRPVPQLVRRVRAASEMGLTRCVAPVQQEEAATATDAWTAVPTLARAIEAVFGSGAGKEKRNRDEGSDRRSNG